MEKVNDLNESLWKLQRKNRRNGKESWAWKVFNIAVATAAIWAIVYGVSVVGFKPAPEIPVNSVSSYSEAFAAAHPDKDTRFVYMGSPDDLEGIVNTAYAGPLETPEVVIFEFGTAKQATEAQKLYGESLNTVVHDNLIIASTSGPLPRLYYDFLGRE